MNDVIYGLTILLQVAKLSFAIGGQSHLSVIFRSFFQSIQKNDQLVDYVERGHGRFFPVQQSSFF
jgi:hypothetical protein